MTWTADEQKRVATELLGTWPGTITQWGKAAFAAYVDTLQHRGLTADQVLTAILTWPAGSDFPPSAPNLAAAARRDPSAPTSAEAVQLVEHVLRAYPPYTGPVTVETQRERELAAIVERARTVHTRVGGFIRSYGLARIRNIDLRSPEWGAANRRMLEKAYAEWEERNEGRQVAALVGDGQHGLARLDPLSAIRRPTVGELGQGRES